MEKITVLVFGNMLVKKDNLPPRLLTQLRAAFPMIEFNELDPTEDLQKEGEKLNIIDTAVGIKRVTLIKDIDMIKAGKVYSLHDFDLGQNLKLLKKMGLLKEVNIFAIPQNYSFVKALKELKILIQSTLLSGSEQHSSYTDHTLS